MKSNIGFTTKKNYLSFCEKDKMIVCPLTSKKCFKLSKSDIGVCALEHNGLKQIICPSLFPKKKIFDLIADKIIKTNNYSIFSEVKLGDNFLDYLMVDKNVGDNYCGIEFQALDTTGNYRWLFGEKVKPFCINWKTTKKTILSQLITKAKIFLDEKKKIVLVIQSSFLRYLNFQNLKQTINGDIIILAFDYVNTKFSNLELHSICFDDLLTAFTAGSVSLKDVVNKTIKGSKTTEII